MNWWAIRDMARANHMADVMLEINVTVLGGNKAIESLSPLQCCTAGEGSCRLPAIKIQPNAWTWHW